MTALIENCVICQSPICDGIEKMLRERFTVADVQDWMREGGYDPPHRNTFMRHRKNHMQVEVVEARHEAIAAQAQRVERTNQDLALLVRDKVVGRILAGELNPNVSDGIRAQELLDRRAEKHGDRELVINMLTLALSGGPLALPEPAVEGEYRDV